MRFAAILVPALAILNRGPKKDDGWGDLHSAFRAMVNDDDEDDPKTVCIFFATGGQSRKKGKASGKSFDKMRVRIRRCVNSRSFDSLR